MTRTCDRCKITVPQSLLYCPRCHAKVDFDRGNHRRESPADGPQRGRAVCIPDEIYAGLDKLCESRRANFKNRRGMIQTAQYLGLDTTVDWLIKNERPYWNGVRRGFEPESGLTRDGCIRDR